VEHEELVVDDVRSLDVTPNTAHRILCSICSETFSKRSNLKRHIKRRHEGAISEVVKDALSNSASIKSSGKKLTKSKAPKLVELSNDIEEEKAP
jgi:hypothetical protein